MTIILEPIRLYKLFLVWPWSSHSLPLFLIFQIISLSFWSLVFIRSYLLDSFSDHLQWSIFFHNVHRYKPLWYVNLLPVYILHSNKEPQLKPLFTFIQLSVSHSVNCKAHQNLRGTMINVIFTTFEWHPCYYWVRYRKRKKIFLNMTI